MKNNKMAPVYVYPGSFNPPTYGHVHLAKQAAELVPNLTIICSENPGKQVIFDSEEAKALFASYDLPKNVRVITLDEFVAEQINPKRLVMVRGIRNENDLDTEKEVLLYNLQKFGVDKYLYLCTGDKYRNVSSTIARQAGQDLDFEKMAEIVSPAVVTALIEKLHGFKNVFMVVGRPGSGKSVFLKKLSEADSNNAYINTDEFNQMLAPVIEAKFGVDADKHDLAVNHDAELSHAVKDVWFALLKEQLLQCKGKSEHIFIEVPFGLRDTKKMYRFLGAKVMLVWCDDKINRARNAGRNTPKLLDFFKKVPGLAMSRRIAKKEKLVLTEIDTSRGCYEPEAQADLLSHKLNYIEESNPIRTLAYRD